MKMPRKWAGVNAAIVLEILERGWEWRPNQQAAAATSCLMWLFLSAVSLNGRNRVASRVRG
jgi:hypothetical protein